MKTWDSIRKKATLPAGIVVAGSILLIGYFYQQASMPDTEITNAPPAGSAEWTRNRPESALQEHTIREAASDRSAVYEKHPSSELGGKDRSVSEANVSSQHIRQLVAETEKFIEQADEVIRSAELPWSWAQNLIGTTSMHIIVQKINAFLEKQHPEDRTTPSEAGAKHKPLNQIFFYF